MNDMSTIFQRLLARETSVAVVGLGYVGAPVALEFSKIFNVIAYDISESRVNHLRDEWAHLSRSLNATTSANALDDASLFIVTVGTPVDRYMRPDLSQLMSATHTVGLHLQPGDYVVYESTVYPGCTESECVPLLEKKSGLRCGIDFKVGYSPERINPGDSAHTLSNTPKIVSGIDEAATEELQEIYGYVIGAGVHAASSIKAAEASKIVENVQRAVNIALVNELSALFSHMGVNLREVLDLASTKWNFSSYTPGLVGGHCIPVDPYYLISEARHWGMDLPLIKSSCAVNDGMPDYIARSVLDRIDLSRPMPAKALIMGVTYKENSDDIRNPAVFRLRELLIAGGVAVDLVDSHADVVKVKRVFGVDMSLSVCPPYDVVIVTVEHSNFWDLDENYFLSITAGKDALLVDLKGIYRGRIKNMKYWAL